MSNNAVISGNYADLKTVKSRSVCQVIIEFPIEHMARFVEMFGGPVPGAEVAVAIARLNEGADSVSHAEPTPLAGAEDGEKPRRRFDDMNPSQQAGILCGDIQFHEWLERRYTATWGKWRERSENPVDCAVYVVRDLCHVQSRGELGNSETSLAAWETIVIKFRAWQADQRLPEQRR